jgi:hypothetical protein
MSKMLSEFTVSAKHDENSLKDKFAMAEATFERASQSLKSGKLTVEHRRYLNELFTAMVSHEVTACW